MEHKIKILKDFLDKTLRSGGDFEEALFCLQNAPRSAEGMSPSHLFYGRIIRNPLLPELADSCDESAAGGAVQIEREKKRKNENNRRFDTNPL